MSHQVAIVTGASRGIGKEIALALAHDKFHVVINYVKNDSAAHLVKKQIEQAGSWAHVVRADIAVAEDRQRLLDAAIEAFGQVNLLVNNAGAGPEVRADLLDADEQSFDQMISVNLKGPFFLTQLVARQMIEDVQQGRLQSPRIVNITSISAFTPSINRGDYCIAKAGMAMATQLFAVRLAEFGINVYEIRPGIIETDMTAPTHEKYDRLILEEGLTPIARWGQPEDVARAVLSIARDLFPFSTGEVMNVDGGFHLRKL